MLPAVLSQNLASEVTLIAAFFRTNSIHDVHNERKHVSLDKYTVIVVQDRVLFLFKSVRVIVYKNKVIPFHQASTVTDRLTSRLTIQTFGRLQTAEYDKRNNKRDNGPS